MINFKVASMGVADENKFSEFDPSKVLSNYNLPKQSNSQLDGNKQSSSNWDGPKQSSSNNEKQGSSGNNEGKHSNSDDSSELRRIQEQLLRDTLNAAEVDDGELIAETNISKVLSARTTQVVIILVLVMLFCQPLFSLDTYYVSATSTD